MFKREQMFRFKTFPNYRQLDQTDCGPTCLKIIAAHYGKYLDIDYLRKISNKSREGTTFENLSKAGNEIGIQLNGFRITVDQLKDELPLPAILYWKQNHFVVIYEISKTYIRISDPEIGLVKYPINEFMVKWFLENTLLILVPEIQEQFSTNSESSVFNRYKFLFNHLRPYKKLSIHLGAALLILLIVQTLLPFLTQSLVDYGINYEDLNFIYLIAIAQIFLITIMLISKIIREQILLNISIGSTKSLLNGFINKVLNLPLSYIESKSIGDYIQRVNDHDRVQTFLYEKVFALFFDVLSISIFISILAFFDINIFIVFVVSITFVFLWSTLFIKKQARLDHELFNIESNKQSQTVQLVTNAAEIKLNGSFNRRKYEWNNLQVLNYKTEIKTLETNQLQYQGGLFILDISYIIIVLISAKGVIDGNLTLGTMLAIQFIIASLSLPVTKLLGFINEFQKASLSLNRITDLLKVEHDVSKNEYLINIEPSTIVIKNLSFKYPSSNNQILKSLNFSIQKNKITALVGESGSGKSTLIKLLLKLYPATKGTISISNQNINAINTEYWRNMCGAVLQDGQLFNDTIERNITESNSNESINHDLLNKVITLSNLDKFIENLPNGMQTKVGENASFISGGEKQRLMIARALYKKPKYLFLDEATSALDSRNEEIITSNILNEFKNRTVVISAHRLSTIKLADEIIFLEHGEIMEIGNHKSLLNKRGAYYKLIKSQLDD